MKNSTQERNHLVARLAGYAAAAGAMISMAHNANGQVVYSGYINLPVEPLPDTLKLDLNNDATIDFNIVASLSSWDETYGGFVHYFGKDGFACVLNGRTDTYNSVLLHSSTYLPRAFDVDDNINAFQTYWWHAASYPIYYAFLSFGHSSNWTFMTASGALNETQYYSGFNYGNFSGSVKYLGIRFQIGPNWHYGWIRINTLEFGSMYVVDWAYEQQPNKGIIAGDKPPQVILNAGIVSTYQETIVISVKFNEDITGLSAGDFIIGNGHAQNLKEWITGREFTLEVTANNPGEVNIVLPAGAVTDLSGNPNESASISYTYEELILDINELAESAFKFYPNPVNGTLYIESETEADICIIDMSGKTILNIENALQETINTSNLQKGIYLMKVITNEGVTMHKFLKD